MGTVDLDAARAARAEAKGEGHSVVLGGETFTLPPEVPAEFGFQAVEGNMREALAALLGERMPDFMAASPSLEDITELVEGIAALYAFDDVGESSASPASSPSTSKRSRPTSRTTTA